MHVKEDLHNGHLRMGLEQAEELSALLAQAEFGDYNQNTAQYFYSELCGEEPSTATISRYILPATWRRLEDIGSKVVSSKPP